MRITERRLRSLIRSVIRESIGGGGNKITGKVRSLEKTYREAGEISIEFAPMGRFTSAIIALIECACDPGFDINAADDHNASYDSDAKHLTQLLEECKKHGLEFTSDDFKRLKLFCKNNSDAYRDHIGGDPSIGVCDISVEILVKGFGLTKTDIDTLLSLNIEHNSRVRDENKYLSRHAQDFSGLKPGVEKANRHGMDSLYFVWK